MDPGTLKGGSVVLMAPEKILLPLSQLFETKSAQMLSCTRGRPLVSAAMIVYDAK
jgi:hypothetical protein